MVKYEVQGRRTGYNAEAIVRDETRLASASTTASALELAGALAADGFTVWVFETGSGVSGKTYKLLEKLDPASHCLPKTKRILRPPERKR